MSVLSAIARGVASRSNSAVGRLMGQKKDQQQRQNQLADNQRQRQNQLDDAEAARTERIQLALAELGLNPASGTPYEDISAAVQEQNDEGVAYGAVPQYYERRDGKLYRTEGAPDLKEEPLPNPIVSRDGLSTLSPNLETPEEGDWIATPISGLPEKERTIVRIDRLTGLTEFSDHTFEPTSDEHLEVIQQTQARQALVREELEENRFNLRQQGNILASDRQRYDKAIDSATNIVAQVAKGAYDASWAMSQIGIATSQLEPAVAQAIIDQVSLATDGSGLGTAGKGMDPEQRRLNSRRRIMIGAMKTIIDLADDEDVKEGMGNLTNVWINVDKYLGGTYMNPKTRRFMQTLSRLKDDHARSQTGAAMSKNEESFYSGMSGTEFTDAEIIMERMQAGIDYSQAAMDLSWEQAIYNQYSGRLKSYNSAIEQYNSFEGRGALSKKSEKSVVDADTVTDEQILSDMGDDDE